MLPSSNAITSVPTQSEMDGVVMQKAFQPFTLGLVGPSLQSSSQQLLHFLVTAMGSSAHTYIPWYQQQLQAVLTTVIRAGLEGLANSLAHEAAYTI